MHQHSMVRCDTVAARIISAGRHSAVTGIIPAVIITGAGGNVIPAVLHTGPTSSEERSAELVESRLVNI